MRRTFNLQMHDRPDGRACTCPGCGAASMRDPNGSLPVCANCSPFMSVSNDGMNTIEAVCRWCTQPVLLRSFAQAERWVQDCAHVLAAIPDHVLAAIRKHFDTRAHIGLRIVPPPVGLPTIIQNGVIQVLAGSVIKVGDMVVAADGTPVGVAMRAAAAGAMVDVQLNQAMLLGPPAAPASGIFDGLLDGDEDDEDRTTGP